MREGTRKPQWRFLLINPYMYICIWKRSFEYNEADTHKKPERMKETNNLKERKRSVATLRRMFYSHWYIFSVSFLPRRYMWSAKLSPILKSVRLVNFFFSVERNILNSLLSTPFIRLFVNTMRWMHARQLVWLLHQETNVSVWMFTTTI